MKKIFYVLVCSSVLTQADATLEKPKALSFSPLLSSAYGALSVRQVAGAIDKCTTEEEVRDVLMQTSLWQDRVSEGDIQILLVGNDYYGGGRDNAGLVAKVLVDFCGNNLNSFPLVAGVIEYLSDSDKESENKLLSTLLGDNVSLDGVEAEHISSIWGASNDMLLGKLADKVINYIKDNPNELSNESQMQIISTIAGHVSPDLVNVLDEVVTRYFSAEIQKINEIEAKSELNEEESSNEMTAYDYIKELKGKMFDDILGGPNCYPEYVRSEDNEWSDYGYLLDGEKQKLANDRFINSVLNFIEKNKNNCSDYFFRAIICDIMRRVPVDQMPRAMWLSWNVNKEKTLERINADMPYETWADFYKGGLLYTLSRAEADGLVKGYGENKASFTLKELRRFISCTTFPEKSLATLLLEKRIDFDGGIPFTKLSSYCKDENMRSFLAYYTFACYDGLFDMNSASRIIRYVPKSQLHDFINTKIDFTNVALDSVLDKLQKSFDKDNKKDAKRMKMIENCWNCKRQNLENQG